MSFIVTNSTLPAWKVVRAYNGEANVENRIKEAKNTLRWEKPVATALKPIRLG